MGRASVAFGRMVRMTTTDQPLSIDDILNEPVRCRGWVIGRVSSTSTRPIASAWLQIALGTPSR